MQLKGIDKQTMKYVLVQSRDIMWCGKDI